MIQKISAQNHAFQGLKFKKDSKTQDIIKRDIPYATSVYTGSHFTMMRRDYNIASNSYIRNSFDRLDKASDKMGYDIEISADTDRADDFIDTKYSLKGENITLSAKITDKLSGKSRDQKCILPSHTTEADAPYITSLPDFIKEILFTMIEGKVNKTLQNNTPQKAKHFI